MIMAIGMGVMAIGGAVLARRAEVEGAKNDAKKFGNHAGSVEFSKERKQGAILDTLSQVQSAQLSEKMAIREAQARAESDAKVIAGAAGVDGQSVDLVINETEQNAMEAEASLNDRVAAQKLQLTTDFVDTHLNAELDTGKMEVKTKSSGQVAAEYALSFGGGYLGGRAARGKGVFTDG